MAPRVITVVGFIQLLFTIGISIFFGERIKILSLVYGSGLAYVNFILLVYLWKHIFVRGKKNVALPVFLIVIKYAILIFVFVQLGDRKSLFDNSVDTTVFALGILLNPISVICSGLAKRILLKKSRG